MCGRFSLAASPQVIAKYFETSSIIDFNPSYNIAPGQAVYIVRVNSNMERELVPVRWGLVPSWMKIENISTRLINARAETVQTKPSFRRAFKSRRCFVIADGFYEWKSNHTKQPYYIYKSNKHPIALAGLWERWYGGDTRPLDSCTIITKAADAGLSSIHDRMPVIIDRHLFRLWLNVEAQDVATLQQVLKNAVSDGLIYHAVSHQVNNPRYNKPDCIYPLTD